MIRAKHFPALAAALCLGSLSALAQAPDPVVVPAPPAYDVTTQVTALIVEAAIRFPWVALLVSLVGILRLALKPVMFLLHQRAAATPDPADDQALDRVERSAWFACFAFALDWFGSIKLPQRPPPADPPRPMGTPGSILLIPLLVAGLAQAGCTTGSGGQGLTPDRVEKLVRLAVWTTTIAWTDRQPETKPKFQAALRGIDALVSDQKWDVIALASALTKSGAGAFTGPEGQLIIAGTTVLIDTFAGESVDLRKQENARAVVLGAQAGLTLALGSDARAQDSPRWELRSDDPDLVFRGPYFPPVHPIAILRQGEMPCGAFYCLHSDPPANR